MIIRPLLLVISPTEDLHKVGWHAPHRIEVTDVHLKFEYLLQVHLSHLADLAGDLQICSLNLRVPRRVGENFVQLLHRVLKRLQLHILRLNSYEHLI